MDPSISFHKYCNYVSDRIDKRNNMLKALAGSSCGQDKETLLLTYNALGKSIANYAAPVWGTNASYSSFKKIQTVQNTDIQHTLAYWKIFLLSNADIRIPLYKTLFCSSRSRGWSASMTGHIDDRGHELHRI